jgi:hypothetical protein
MALVSICGASAMIEKVAIAGGAGSSEFLDLNRTGKM